MGGRLAKLYDARETGEFSSGELASRIRSLFRKREELVRGRAEAEEALHHHSARLADAILVKGYVEDLRGFLENSGIVERKAFLKSFVERIDVEPSHVTVTYTIPM